MLIAVLCQINNLALPLPFSETGFSVIRVNETCDDDIILDAPSFGFQLRYNEWAVTWTVSDTFK
jgi:hypothetical protein